MQNDIKNIINQLKAIEDTAQVIDKYLLHETSRTNAKIITLRESADKTTDNELKTICCAQICELKDHKKALTHIYNLMHNLPL